MQFQRLLRAAALTVALPAKAADATYLPVIPAPKTCKARC